ncbi:conserved hypothetical protein [Candidatus Terasakiella magnetica]|uniref:4Fe-4S ferredoxin-type domain-containing protein n=1 Tax=Candidatus Terasakiella magnetica TaxID=1867952 RepID=A0A1C3RGR9_9PROT|nr:hypothetical protein [Candidatus Terasakiella magnetica]SCA56471.1 conserved hypothetical protein [Candidatus Terasakiella magnetica]
MVSYLDIDKELEPYGLCLRGGFVENSTYLLVGNVGSKMWKQFGREHEDWIEPNPMDNWTRKSMDALAQKIGATVIYPFDGPNYAPFQFWAEKADCVFPSPIGPLIHPKYGLWHAYRAVFLFDQAVEDVPDIPDEASPCERCFTKPCLSSCPVEAFSQDKPFKFQKCIDFLNKNLEGSCMKYGCLARQACPVGKQYAYEREHAFFHLERFRRLAPK